MADEQGVKQARAKVRYLIRASDLPELTRLVERVRKIAQGAALMTETRMESLVAKDKNLALLDQKRRANGGMLPTVEDAERASILLDQIAPVSVKDGMLVRERPVPGAFSDLAKVVDDWVVKNVK